MPPLPMVGTRSWGNAVIGVAVVLEPHASVSAGSPLRTPYNSARNQGV